MSDSGSFTRSSSRHGDKLKQADNVSMDSLAKSLRDTETKLLAQHQGRSVDFHVVVKKTANRS